MSAVDSIASAIKASECPNTPAVPFTPAITEFVMMLKMAVFAAVFLISFTDERYKKKRPRNWAFFMKM
jgi:hypothetical protein